MVTPIPLIEVPGERVPAVLILMMATVGVTVKLACPEMLPEVAVIVAVPEDTIETNPDALTVAIP